MKLPKLPYQDQLNKSYQVQFGGYNHTEGARDGEIWDMENMTADDYPVLASRNKRWKYNLFFAGMECIKAIQPVAEELYMVVCRSSEDIAVSGVVYPHGNHVPLPNNNNYPAGYQCVYLPGSGNSADTLVYEWSGSAWDPVDYAVFLAANVGHTYTYVFPYSARYLICNGNASEPFDQDTYHDVGNYLYVLDAALGAVLERVPNVPSLSTPDMGAPVKFTFQLMPHFLIIMPDKIVLNLETGEVRNMDAKWSNGALISYLGVLDGIPTWRNTIKAKVSTVNFSALFRVGDTVNISGDTIAGNNKSAVIEEIDGYKMRFAENIFEVDFIKPTYIETNPVGFNPRDTSVVSDDMTLSRGAYYLEVPLEQNYSVFLVDSDNNGTIWNKTGIIRSDYKSVIFQQSGSSTWTNVTTSVKTGDQLVEWKNANSYYSDHDVNTLKIERHIPDFDFMMVSKNRLWGCQKGSDDIYASVLGDPFNFYRSGTGETDSWYMEGSGVHGDYTGCIEYLGYPHFFKENHIFKIYGDRPTNFTLYDIAATGVKAGSEDSLAIAGNVLFYHARIGIMAYTGGSPSLISQSLGNYEFKNAIGGSDDIKYYVFMESAEGEKQLFVYDVSRGLWHVENVGNINSFCRLFNHTWAFFDGNLVAIHIVDAAPKNSTEETAEVPWMAEFAPFTEGNPNVKGVNKIQVRCRHEGPLRIYLQFDDGPWEERYSFTPPTEVPLDQQHTKLIPIIPRRTDNFRLKLEGEGKVKIYSLAIQYNVGSEK